MTKIVLETDGIIRQLYRKGGDTIRKDILAGLRAGKNVTSQRARIFWPVMMENLSSDYLASDGPTFEENAVYSAVRLYAIHQQGNDEMVYASGKEEGNAFFEALKKVRISKQQNNIDTKSLDRRIQLLLATTNFGSLVNSLVQIEKIVKASGFNKVDYSRLAQDLLYFQYSYENANKVLLKWGREYFSYSKNIK